MKKSRDIKEGDDIINTFIVIKRQKNSIVFFFNYGYASYNKFISIFHTGI